MKDQEVMEEKKTVEKNDEDTRRRSGWKAISAGVCNSIAFLPLFFHDSLLLCLQMKCHSRRKRERLFKSWLFTILFSLLSVNEWSCLTHLFVVQTHLLYPDFSCCLCLLTSSSCYCPPSHSSSSLPRDSPSQSMAWYTRTKCSETTYQRNGWRDREKKRLWNLFPVMFRESFTSFVKCRVNKVSLRWDGKGKECACESFIVLLSICLSVKIERKKRRSFKGWNQSARYTEKTVYTVCICRISFFSSQTKKKYILKKRKTR